MSPESLQTPATTQGVEKPLLRGVLHQYSAFIALGAGAVLAVAAPTARASWAVVAFSASLVMLFGVSATYHRVHWRPVARARMRRADHASIFVLIAGTTTPVALLGMPEPAGSTMLAYVSLGALVGVLQTIFWIRAPKVVTAALAVAVGWTVVPFWSDFSAALTGFQLNWVIAGGVVYTLGAAAYALKKPNPLPKWFGYHEVFHLCTVVAAVMHFVAIYSIVLGP